MISRTTTAAARRGALHRGPILAALMATMALSAMDNTIVATAIPQVVRDLGGFSLFSWVFSAYLLTQTVTIPMYGKLADQWGRKPVLVVGTLVFLTFSGMCALSVNMVSLIAFRGLQGVGAGAIMATVNTLAGDLYELSERGRVQGYLSSVWGVSAVLGPALGGLLAQYASWRWIFVINLPVGAVSLTLIGRYLHERVTRARHRVDVPGALLILVAAGALVFGLLQGGVAWGWLSPPSIAVFAVAIVATVAAVVLERRAAEPIMPPWIWRRRVLAGSSVGALGLGLLVIGPTTFLPTCSGRSPRPRTTSTSCWAAWRWSPSWWCSRSSRAGSRPAREPPPMSLAARSDPLARPAAGQPSSRSPTAASSSSSWSTRCRGAGAGEGYGPGGEGKRWAHAIDEPACQITDACMPAIMTAWNR